MSDPQTQNGQTDGTDTKPPEAKPVAVAKPLPDGFKTDTDGITRNAAGVIFVSDAASGEWVPVTPTIPDAHTPDAVDTAKDASAAAVAATAAPDDPDKATVAAFFAVRDRALSYLNSGDAAFAAAARGEFAVISMIEMLARKNQGDAMPAFDGTSFVTVTAFSKFVSETAKQIADLNSQVGLLTDSLAATRTKLDGYVTAATFGGVKPQ